ncbi:hypothetical protein G8V07_14605 [Clostridium botulinum D/C]|uniref:hypothetical protein n=1 Tax=Clostridium botulinum TaxID=1491 RepID=UPI001E5ED771|nr:hypothetical protein [Clostridium botulinum]MCD3321674.1 hypothetical protein [Clostridium botulinum D/C]MCD3324954.1 hypothetical protein [Clostridium botulinum D/C]MCD3327732.1 hypothetical protein [Clostridium botulinum D/C]
MNNLENSIKDCITQELGKGIVEEVLREKLKASIEASVKDLFGWSGDIKKVIEDKIKSVMIPYLENYDYSQYITKLDSVLVDVLKDSALENTKLLENFKILMSSDKEMEQIKLSDIYNKWCDYCEKKVDKSNFDNYDYEDRYINVSMNVEEMSHSWNDWETQIVTFECEEDENLNIEFTLERWKKYDKQYTLRGKRVGDLHSLRNLSEFDVFMVRLNQTYSKIELDTESARDEIYVEYEE